MRKGFSEEDGTLTPSMKLKRNVAMQKYAAFIERLYEASEAIIFE
jgi:long-chain acyl-CoA synthetase